MIAVLAAASGLAGAIASGLLAVGLSGAPQRADVQQAYDAAKTTSGARHQDDLEIRDTDCGALNGRRVYCQIQFVRKSEPSGRLYFTVVTLDGEPGRWTLVGGLCRGP